MKLLLIFVKALLFVLFGLCFFLAGILLAAEGSVDYNLVADAGFTLLEQILIFTGVGGGGLALVLIRIARQGTKAVLKSLDSNPHVDNPNLIKHARSQGDKKSEKLFNAIKES